jgi:hypothetical protein
MDFECAAGLHPEPDVSSKHHFVSQERYELFSAKADTAVPIHEHLTAICCYRRLILFITTTKSCIISEQQKC